VTLHQAADNKWISFKKQTMFSSPFSFDGRIRRLEYAITIIICSIINELIMNYFQEQTENIAILILQGINFWLLFAQGAKRCHDISRSGWIQLVPFMVFWMIFEKSSTGVNEYGRNPKE
jgi:uncharacterized membrane protein YhaH (DUF805 family)